MQDHGHHVQFFDTSDSRGDAIFGFLREGLLAGDVVLIVATSATWDSLCLRCRDQGLDVTAARAAGWLVIHDASETLAQFMRFGQPHWPTFQTRVGALVRGLKAGGARLRVYGEMVDLLARTGEFTAAAQLEEFWNRLQATEPCALFCGYSAEHFGNPRDREALRRICQRHGRVQSDPRDVLGNFLLKTHGAC